MEITKEDAQSLHMTFSNIGRERLLSEGSKIWLKGFKERLVNYLQNAE